MFRPHENFTDLILDFFSHPKGSYSVRVRRPYVYLGEQKRVLYKNYYDTLYRLKKRGVVAGTKTNIRLTKKGRLELLLEKSQALRPEKWDGKWRMYIFDIPCSNCSN